MGSAAASVAIAAMVGIWFFLTSGPVVYSTGVGEQASFSLPDGSVVNLNAQSSLEVHYTKQERTVHLLTGEVLFNVKKRPDRPFLVLTERTKVRAVGTSFNVRQRGVTTTVTVADANIEKATSWRQRRLVFDSWQVADLVAEFNLYSDTGIVLEDPDLASRSISGAFDADDPDSFGLFLSEAGLALTIQRADGAMVLRRPREAD